MAEKEQAFLKAKERIQEALQSNSQSLDLSGLGLEKVPESLGNLSSLKTLNLRDNQLSQVPESLGNLSSLEELILAGNQLSQVPESLGNLSSLKRLFLHNNQLSEVPGALGSWSSLEELYLYNNQLRKVPESLGNLSSLKMLDLEKTQLSELPKSLRQLNSLKFLYLHDNKALQIPPEILGPTIDEVGGGEDAANPQDILNYYFSIADRDSRPLNEAKLILVGFGAVGKTSLVKRLVYGKFDPTEGKTDGINITEWPINIHPGEDIRLNIWDFGGQEIMHSTHQFFLTERSLYLLVLNGRQGHEDEDAEYWLNLIESFGKDSPVIVVLNKFSETAFDLNRSYLRQNYPNIQDFIETDCGEGKNDDHPEGFNIDSLRQKIFEVTDSLDNLRTPFPSSWFKVKDYLSEINEDYISFERFRDLCTENGEHEPDKQNSLANILHQLGISLNYRDDPRLRDTHILNPHWVTKGIYTLLNSNSLAKQKGELNLEDVTELLSPDEYPSERRDFLCSLMKKFELSFRFPDRDDTYLIPELLPKDQDEEAKNFDPNTCLNFQYHYPIQQEGILPRFIVRTRALSSDQPRWRTGVILKFEDNRALIRANKTDRCVYINIDGPTESRRNLLAIIRSHFKSIHQSFEFPIQEMVPIFGHPTSLVPYSKLVALEKKGLPTYPEVIDTDVIDVDIKKSLDGVDVQDNRGIAEKLDRKAKDSITIFCSYSHKDEIYREELDAHVTLLKEEGKISLWHDRLIPLGNEWEPEIHENLNRAQIILLLISVDFISSRYCRDIELKRAMERHEAKEAQVIPIILRPCDWESAAFGKLQGIHAGQPISIWDDRDSAWTLVAKQLRKTIEEKQGNKDKR